MCDEVAKFSNEKVRVRLNFDSNYITYMFQLRITSHNVDYEHGIWGSEKLRIAMANHMNEYDSPHLSKFKTHSNRYFKPFEPVDPENILFGTGCTGLCDILGYTIAEPGDGILLSRPIYQAFERDFGSRAKVKTVGVSFNGNDQFSLEAVKSYEDKLLESNASGTKIRALLICNPHNPLGQCYPPEALTAYMRLCAKHQIHLIVDEIYAVSHYKIPTLPKGASSTTVQAGVPDSTDAVPFHSILRFPPNKYISSTHLHVLYGLSKDFAAGGLRLGCIHSLSKPLIQAMGALSPFSWPSNLSEALAIAMLTDHPWRHAFLADGQRRLGERAAFARQVLDEMGIPHNGDKACAGFFLWIDLRRWVALVGGGWEGEKVVRGCVEGEGLFLTPGVHLNSEEPGFFRFCFATGEVEVREGMGRLKRALGKIERGEVGGKKGEDGIVDDKVKASEGGLAKLSVADENKSAV